jgi:lipase
MNAGASRAPVVFVHGLVGTLQVPDLAGYFEQGALAPELLGYATNAAAAPAELTLARQAEHLDVQIAAAFGARAVHVVGHSVGGAIAMLYAERQPARIASLVSVEGNFSLKDAFWSARIARMSAAEAEAMLASWRADPAAWLASSGIAQASAPQLEIADYWLQQQPASTLRAMARAVIATTGAADYADRLRALFARHPVHLVAGERSRVGWDVPPWAEHAAASLTQLAGCGHLMMIEDTTRFAETLRGLLHR